MERQQNNKQCEGMDRESNFYFRKLRNIEVLLLSAKKEQYFKGKVKTLSEEIFRILYDKNGIANASQCADFPHDQLEQDIQEAQENLEEETDFVEIVPSESTFLDVETDVTEATYLETSETSSNVNGSYKVFDKSVENVAVSTIKVVRNNEEKEANYAELRNSNENSNTKQIECFESNSIIQKLEKARKLAEAKIREGMTVAVEELVRLRDAHADSSRQLGTQRTICKLLAETEEQKRAALEQEIERVKDQKLRTEFIANEANRQCAVLGRKNMRLQAHLKEARLKLAHINAERNEFRLQLTTLRGTLGLLAREPVPAISPYAYARTPTPTSSYGRSGNQQFHQPQIQDSLQEVFANDQATNEPSAGHTLPPWASDTRKNESSPAATISHSEFGDDHGDTKSGHHAVTMLGNDAGKLSNDCEAQSRSDHLREGLHDDDRVAEVVSVDQNLGTDAKANSGFDTEETYETDFSDSESSSCSVYDAEDVGDDYSLVYDDMSLPSPQSNLKNTPKHRNSRHVRTNNIQI